MSRSGQPPLYVVDTTVLSNFARVDRLDLLEAALAPYAVMPPAVRHELDAGETLGVVQRRNWAWLPIIELNAVEQALAEFLHVHLNTGEAECLAVAENRRGSIVTDDRAARNQAVKRGVIVSGTIGVLKMLLDNEKLSLPNADLLLAAMVAEGFYSPVRSLAKLIGR